MAADLGGRWITTDSGQHILIKTGGGSVRAQVKAHFAAKGQPDHPDIEKTPAITHPKGVDPRTGGKTLREQAAEHRAGKGTSGERIERVANRSGEPWGMSPDQETSRIKKLERTVRLTAKIDRLDIGPATANAGRELDAIRRGNRSDILAARNAFGRHFSPSPSDRTATHEIGKELSREAEARRFKIQERARLKADIPARAEMLARKNATSYTRASNRLQSLPERFTRKRAAAQLDVQTTIQRGKKLRALATGVEKPPVPAPTLREQAARARPNAAIKAAQPGYREGATTLRDKIASQKALREQAELHRVNPKNRARTSEGLWEQRRIEREAMAAAPSVAHSGGRVVLGELRAKIEAEKEPFDKAMIRAAKRGKVSLFRADNPLEAKGMETLKTPSGEPRHIGYFGGKSSGAGNRAAAQMEGQAARAKPAPTLREQAASAREGKGESKAFSPAAPARAATVPTGHAAEMRAKVGTALATGSPTEQLGRLHNLKGENTAAAMRAGGSTVETRAVHAEIQGHMDRLERTVASKTPTLREMAASVRVKPSGSELEHETAKEIAANKRVPLKGQSDFTEKVRTVSTSEATGTTPEERKRMEFKKPRSFAALKREQFPYRNRLQTAKTARQQAAEFALRPTAPARSKRLF